jgi:hypothetical protein
MHARFALPALALGACAVSTAWAVTEFKNTNASPTGAHYRQGYSEPLCTVQDGRMTCTGTQIAGIGNLDGDVVLSVSASGTCVCDNGGGNRVEVKSQGTSTTSGDALTRNRNGTLIVSEVSAAAPSESDLLATTDCPKQDSRNKNWTKSLEGYTLNYTYTLTMEGFGEPVIHQPPR